MFQDIGCGKMLEEQILSSLRCPLWLTCLTVVKEKKKVSFTLLVKNIFLSCFGRASELVLSTKESLQQLGLDSRT